MDGNQQEKKPEKPVNLPESEDKFWGDGEQFSGPIQKFVCDKKHIWRQKGHVAICESCPLTHALYLKPNQEVQEGKIVAKKAIK